jgi:hypothetical protein
MKQFGIATVVASGLAAALIGLAAPGQAASSGPSDAPQTINLQAHTLQLALPAFAPALVAVGVIVYITVRDRRKGDDAHREDEAAAEEDDSP